MLKAKVPPSWVKRVLEVDGKDARVLDLDPDQTLADQLPKGAIDEFGNVYWDKFNLSKRLDADETPLAADNNIPVDTFASVKAELAAMRAKAGEMTSGLRKVPADESHNAIGRSSIALGKGTATKQTTSSAATISSEAVIASNARIDRLNAIRTAGGGGDASSGVTELGLTDIGRRRQSVDEIRRRLPQPPPPSVSSTRRTFPQSANPAITSNGSVNQTSDNIPLKGQWPCCLHDLFSHSKIC
jgi:hypothetical protein